MNANSIDLKQPNQNVCTFLLIIIRHVTDKYEYQISNILAFCKHDAFYNLKDKLANIMFQRLYLDLE